MLRSGLKPNANVGEVLRPGPQSPPLWHLGPPKNPDTSRARLFYGISSLLRFGSKPRVASAKSPESSLVGSWVSPHPIYPSGKAESPQLPTAKPSGQGARSFLCVILGIRSQYALCVKLFFRGLFNASFWLTIGEALRPGILDIPKNL